MPKPTADSSAPAELSVKVSPRGSARLKAGHPWVYRSDVTADDVPPGALVRVTDLRGKFLGSALYSSSSQIAIRMIAGEPVADLPALIAGRIRAAIAYRQKFVADTDAYRVVFSEADFLPGLIADRYNDVLSVQILTQGVSIIAASLVLSRIPIEHRWPGREGNRAIVASSIALTCRPGTAAAGSNAAFPRVTGAARPAG